MVGGDTTPNLDGALTLMPTALRITPHTGEQAIARDEDLVLDWEGAAPDFVNVFVASGRFRDRFAVPNNGG